MYPEKNLEATTQDQWRQWLQDSGHPCAFSALALAVAFERETGKPLPPGIAQIIECEEELGAEQDLTLCWSYPSQYFEVIFCVNKHIIEYVYIDYQGNQGSILRTPEDYLSLIRHMQTCFLREEESTHET